MGHKYVTMTGGECAVGSDCLVSTVCTCAKPPGVRVSSDYNLNLRSGKGRLPPSRGLPFLSWHSLPYFIARH